MARSANAEAARILQPGLFVKNASKIPDYPLHVRLAAARGTLRKDHALLFAGSGSRMWLSCCSACGVNAEQGQSDIPGPCAPPLSAELVLTLLREMGGCELARTYQGKWLASDPDVSAHESGDTIPEAIAAVWLNLWEHKKL